MNATRTDVQTGHNKMGMSFEGQKSVRQLKQRTEQEEM